MWPRPRCQLGRGYGFVSHSPPGNCAPPVYLTLAQVLQAISPAPQELPKESRMNSPFPDTKTRACPGSQRLGLFAAEESWAPEPEATPSSNCWATLCLACPCDHGASHPHDPLFPCHLPGAASPGPCDPFSLPRAPRRPRSVSIQGLVPSAPRSELGSSAQAYLWSSAPSQVKCGPVLCLSPRAEAPQSPRHSQLLRPPKSSSAHDNRSPGP